MTTQENILRKPLNEFSPMKPTGSFNSESKNGSSSPFKKPLTGSSRVIESLHNEIDTLKDEQIKLKNQNQELKKSSELVIKRRDELLEQLSNTKHENEMVNSLLQRKQRRIHDLEESLSDVTYKSDDMNIKLQSLETRCRKLSESEAKSTAEYERIKIAYDAIVLAQNEYRSLYELEIKELKQKLAEFVENKGAQIAKSLTLINKSDATIYRSIKSIALRSNEIEDKTEERHSKVQESLHQILNSVEDQTATNEELFDTAKIYFEKFSEKLNISKEDMIKSYNEKFPDKQVNSEIITSDEIEAITESSELKIKKRGERSKSAIDQRSLSVEQRIGSLTKDLNNVIPNKDRSSSTPQIIRIKSVRRSSSFNSKQFSELNSPSAPQTPQRQVSFQHQQSLTPSKKEQLRIDGEIQEDEVDDYHQHDTNASPSLVSEIGSGSTEKTSPEIMSESKDTHDTHDLLNEDELDLPESSSSKKKKRRRRRKNKSRIVDQDQEQEQEEEENTS